MDTIAGRLPFADDLHRLLRAVDSYPVREPDRLKLLRAIDLLESERWTRVIIGLNTADLAALPTGRRTFEGELGDVLGYAEAIARRYDFPKVDVGLVAVALAASAGTDDHKRLRVMRVVAEAFVGDLAELENVLNLYPAREHATDERRINDDDADTRSHVVWNHVEGRDRALWGLRLVDTLVRSGVVMLLVLLAVASPHWWAWLLIPAPLLATSGPLDHWPRSVGQVPKRTLPTGAPLVLIVAMGAEFAGLPLQGALLGLAVLVLDSYDIWAEWRQTGWALRTGPAIRSLGDAQRVVATLFQVPERITIAGRIRRIRAVWGPPVALGLLLMQISPLWVPATLLAALFARRRLFATVAATVGFALLHVPPGLIGLALVAGLVGAVTDGVASRFPRRRGPVRWILTGRAPLRGLIAQQRIRHALAFDRVGVAIDLVRRAQRSGLEEQLSPLLAWAMLRGNRPGEAIRLVKSAHPRYQRTTAFIELFANIDLQHTSRAEEIALKIRSPRPGRKPLPAMSDELLARSGTWEQSQSDARALLPALAVATHRAARAGRPLETVRLLRACGVVCTSIAPEVGVGLVEDSVWLAHVSVQRTATQSRLRRSLAAAASGIRPLQLEFLLGVLSQQELMTDLLGDEFPVRRGATLQEATAFLFEFDRPFETATSLARVADRLQDLPGLRLQALELRLTALAAFNIVRHDLTDPDERTSWFAQFNEQLEKVLAQAARGQDWATLAELLETARLQAAPDALDAQPWSSDAAAPFIRVRSRSRMEDSSVQVMDPVAYDLESVAALTLGPDTWWWSSWATKTTFYWSLVPPAGSTCPVTGGVRALGEVRDIVAQLREALPGAYTGEPEEMRTARLAMSPLLHGPRGAERRLMAAAARLLPEPLLVQLARATPAQPMCLAIAPAPVLAPVPWNALVIGSGDVRLVEVAHIVTAPPASLLASLAARRDSSNAAGCALVKTAVVDPGGDLKFARQLAVALPGDAVILGERPGGHPVEALRDLLNTAPRASTFVYAGHTLPPTGVDRAASLYLGALDGAGQPDPSRIVPASLLVSGALKLPEQVIALACASSDIENVEAGEWTTLGPALLWAGADRAVLTSYPIFDTAEFDSRLVDTRRPLHEVLRSAQLDCLDVWRRTGEQGAPVHWAGHIALGIFDPAAEALPAQQGAVDLIAAPGLIDMLDDAAKAAAKRGDRIVRATDLRQTMIFYGWDDLVPVAHLPLTKLTVRVIWVPAIFRELLAILQRRVTRAEPVRATSVDREVAGLLRATRMMAVRHRHHRIDTEHLMVAALQQRGWQAALARLVTGWNPLVRESERALLEEYDPAGRLWEPHTDALEPEAIALIHAALGVRQRD